MSRGAALLLAALALALAPPRAIAQTAPAPASEPASAPAPPPDDRVRQAAEAYDRGEFDRALELLQAAYAETSKPALLFNMAQVQRSKGDCATAAATYRRFLDTTTSDDPNRQRAVRYESDMLACAARASEQAAPEASRPGAASSAPALTPRPADASSPPAVQVTHPAPAPLDEPERTWTQRQITAYTLVGAGIAAAAAGGAMALKARSTFREPASTLDYMERDRAGNRWQWAARIVGAAGLVSAATGVTLLLF
jgi:hypothetical protein